MESLEPNLVSGPDQVRLGVLSHLQVMERVAADHFLMLARAQETSGGVLADDVEHVVARLSIVPVQHDKTLVDERAHTFEHISDFGDGSADFRDVLQLPTTCEYREATEQRLGSTLEQIVTPSHRVTDGPLAQR